MANRQGDVALRFAQGSAPSSNFGLAWLGLAWLGLAWLGLAWLGLAWLGLAWLVISTLHIQPLKMEQIDGSETSALRNQTPGIHPNDYSQYPKHGESLKSRIK
jgi:hypothetical protein